MCELQHAPLGGLTNRRPYSNHNYGQEQGAVSWVLCILSAFQAQLDQLNYKLLVVWLYRVPLSVWVSTDD